MKIGIITFINTINFGALLQAYALQEVLSGFGNDVEVIRYINKNIEEKEKNNGKITLKKIYKKIIMGKATKRKEEKFKAFENNNIKFGLQLNNNFEQINKLYDLFVTGSDQVWNMKITNKDWNYFLDFVSDDKKKISYAPSFGNDKFPEEEKNNLKEQVKKFKALSVREESGKKLIEEISSKKAEVVLDPTLLLNKEEWESKIKFKPKIEHYILVYIPHNKKIVFDFVDKLKKEKRLPVVYLSISPKIQKGVKTIYDASPDEFLGWIKNADYVVTGSFHGTAFALNLNKQFFYESTGDGSRINNLIKICGTEDRNLSNIKDFNKKIDYDIVNKKLNKERMKSLNWLKQASRSE